MSLRFSVCKNQYSAKSESEESMPRPKRVGPPNYEPTVQFRPVPRLSQLVRPLAEREGLGLNEAYRNLAALAAVGLDVRYYPLINQLAQATGGTSAFTQACLRVHDAFDREASGGRT